MLKDVQVRNAAAGATLQKLPDGGGLYLFVTPPGGKFWRWRYKFGGREKLLTLGSYPKIGLSKARALRDEARAELERGVDPGQAKKLRKLAGIAAKENGFEAVARAWHATQKPAWSEHHAKTVLSSLQPVFKAIGAMPIGDIEPPQVLAVLKSIQDRGAVETGRRVRQRMSDVFVYAIASGIGKHDPAAVVAKALAPTVKGRQPAITDLVQARAMLAAAEAIPAHPITKLSLRFLALTSVRPGEVRGARWDEFEDLDGKRPVWRIPASRMKMKAEHWVPLSRDATAVLRAVRELGIRGELVFPSTRKWTKPLSTNALGYLLHRAGYHGQHVPHGWRSTFSTIMNERFPGDRAVIDLMLAHVPRNEVEGAYNRAAHLERRRKLAELWAGLLLTQALPAVDLLGGARRPPTRTRGLERALSPGSVPLCSRANRAESRGGGHAAATPRARPGTRS